MVTQWREKLSTSAITLTWYPHLGIMAKGQSRLPLYPLTLVFTNESHYAMLQIVVAKKQYESLLSENIHFVDQQTLHQFASKIQ